MWNLHLDFSLGMEIRRMVPKMICRIFLQRASTFVTDALLIGDRRVQEADKRSKPVMVFLYV